MRNCQYYCSEYPRKFLGKEGFTLLELLVTIAIFGLVVGIGLAQYQRFNRRQTLKGAAANLINNLRLAQGKAASGEKFFGAACVTLVGYQVAYVDTVTYLVQPYCLDGSGSFVALSTNSTTYTLPQNVVFNGAFANFRFLTVGRGSDQAISFRLKYQSDPVCFGVSVSFTGDIVDTGESAC